MFNAFDSYVKRLRSSAKVRKLDFIITRDFLYSLYKKQGGYCALSGIELRWSAHTKAHRLNCTTASVDRINSDRGYTEENIQWTHKHLNKMKGTLKQEEFIKYCRLVARKHNDEDRVSDYMRGVLGFSV